VRQTWVFVRFASAHATACIHWAEDKDRFDIQGTQGKKPAGSFAIGFKGKSVAANWIKPWLKPSVWGKTQAQKKRPC
jgi:hypothetical protein